MQLPRFVVPLGLLFASVTSASPLQLRADEDALTLLSNLQQQAIDSLEASTGDGNVGKRACSLANARIRKDW